MPAGAQYCVACGARVAGGEAAVDPTHLTERKFVTVMFVDVVGSLGVIRDKDPEDAHELLTAALAVMTEAVHAYGGVIVDRQGDGVMAIFGAPAAQEDHAARACLAALRLHTLVRLRQTAQFALRAGLNSGEVAVGSALNDFATDYTATGAVVHIAARLQSEAPANATVMSEHTAALVRDVMLTELLGQVLLKGLDTPIALHRLIGPIAEVERVRRGTQGLFVGRATELSALEAALAEALEGSGCVFGVSGEAGIGKTALVERFIHRHARDIEWIRFTAAHHTSVPPFQPFAEIVKQLFDLGDVSPHLRRKKVNERLSALALDRRICAPPLLDLLELSGLPKSWAALAPQLRHDRIGSAVIQVILAASRHRKLVVVLEDLQRADSATIQLVEQLAKTVSQHSLLIIIAFRPELRHPWEHADGYRQLRLDPLTEVETRALITGFIGKAVQPWVERRLLGWSKGNPLFLRESVRAMVEAGAINDPVAANRIAVPPTIGAIIAARIDRLPPAAKQVLLAACVLGKQFHLETLAVVSGLDPAELSAQIQALRAAEFVGTQGTQGSQGSTVSFEHGLFQEVGYATLLRRQRRSLHQIAFLALRTASPIATSIEELAHHAFGGELWAEAFTLCREAGLRAASRYSNREAAMHLENATVALGCADVEGRRLADAIALRLELRSVSIPLLRLDRIGTLLSEADAMAKRLGDLSVRARVTAFKAGHAYLTRNPIGCIELCRDALRLARRTGDARLRIAPTLYLAQAQYALGRYRRVVDALEGDASLQDGNLSGAAVGLPVRPRLMRGYWLAIAWAELGRFGGAEALSHQLVSSADERQPFELLYALTGQGFILMLRGELGAALEASAAALTIAEHNDIAFIIPVLASQVGFLLAKQGRVKEGLALARRAMREAEEIGIYAGRSRWCARLAEVCILAGEKAAARTHAEAALKLAEDNHEMGYLCSALRLRAKTRVFDSDLDAAKGDLQRALDVARLLRLGPALAKCHFDTGTLFQCAGRVAEARREWGIAKSAFLRYQMADGLARTAQALARLETAMPPLGAEAFFGSSE
jgi:class 3 adenylate cyclase/tetratricopeptide (TPR) repeat protein